MNYTSRQLLVPDFPKITVIQRRIQNHNEFQFYVLYGTKPGPWVKVGINNTEYLVGFLPQSPKKRAVRKPNVTPIKPVPSVEI